MEKYFIIGWGLSGGFGGAQNFTVVISPSLEEAEKEAYENACEEYTNYEGNNGLRTIDEIIQEEDLENEEAEIQYNEERENWLDYLAVPFTKEAEEKYKGYHYQNDYKEITDKLLP